eukprot:4746720-Pleurochrysis_carterae.AAC.1
MFCAISFSFALLPALSRRFLALSRHFLTVSRRFLTLLRSNFRRIASGRRRRAAQGAGAAAAEAHVGGQYRRLGHAAGRSDLRCLNVELGASCVYAAATMRLL